MDCALCNIHKNESDRVVAEDKLCFTALNIEPVKPAHLMVMPIRHIKNMLELYPEEAYSLLLQAQRAQYILEQLFPNESPLIAVNCWGQRTQEHLHVHILSSKFGIRGLFAGAEHLSSERTRVTLSDLLPTADKIHDIFRRSHAPE